MAAGGEPAHPALNGGRDLKQRRIGLFWSLPAFHRRRGLLKRLVLHCQVCGREFPNQSTAAQFGTEFEALSRLHRATWPRAYVRKSFFGRSVAGPFGSVLRPNAFRNSCATAVATASTRSPASSSTSKSCATTT